MTWRRGEKEWEGASSPRPDGFSVPRISKSKQVIEVRKGDNPDIRIAVIRRMIVIIREHETEDFSWESHRLGREVRLSARASDTAGLEAFMMREFDFDTGNPP